MCIRDSPPSLPPSLPPHGLEDVLCGPASAHFPFASLLSSHLVAGDSFQPWLLHHPHRRVPRQPCSPVVGRVRRHRDLLLAARGSDPVPRWGARLHRGNSVVRYGCGRHHPQPRGVRSRDLSSATSSLMIEDERGRRRDRERMGGSGCRDILSVYRNLLDEFRVLLVHAHLLPICSLISVLLGSFPHPPPPVLRQSKINTEGTRGHGRGDARRAGAPDPLDRLPEHVQASAAGSGAGRPQLLGTVGRDLSGRAVGVNLGRGAGKSGEALQEECVPRGEAETAVANDPAGDFRSKEKRRLKIVE
eukprot:630955-Hanusia_phi.AAC.3